MPLESTTNSDLFFSGFLSLDAVRVYGARAAAPNAIFKQKIVKVGGGARNRTVVLTSSPWGLS